MFRMSTLLRAVPRGMHPLTPTTQVSTGFVKVKQNSFVEGRDHAEADLSKPSQSVAEAKFRVRRLYRNIVRDMPRVMASFELDNAEPEVYLGRIKQRFVDNGNVVDFRHIDILRAKGEMEYQEGVRMFSTKSHMGQYLPNYNEEGIQFKFDDESEDHSDFLNEFLTPQRRLQQ